MTINKGQTVAIVGPSGCGKSTFTYMINRLYSPSKGTIFLNDQDYLQIPTSQLRSLVTLVSQNDKFLKGKISSFIASFSENPDYEKIHDAARNAQAFEFINSLPDGFNTELGSDIKLSTGQVQRLNIARAFYKGAQIMIFDEATSALDSPTEDKILTFIKNANNINIIISHRLNTVTRADRIYLFGKGRIISSGSHEDLMNKSSEYRILFDKQIH